MNKILNYIKTNSESVIVLFVFFSMIFLSLFMPYGFSIFIVMAFPFWLSTLYKEDIVIDITMAVVTAIFLVVGLFAGFKIADQGAVMLFSLLSGYIIFNMTKIYYDNNPKSLNKK